MKKLRDKLHVFVVSDAHMGWQHAEQPSVEAQASAMRVIKKTFPDLDLIVDTGDAHHSNLDHKALSFAKLNWLEQIETAAGSTPFLYVPGNHELMDFRLGDSEAQACSLGSLELRPYYGFSICGIHFVSVPQLLDPAWITNETLQWLEEDLRQHAHETTIILAHNSLKGTTNNGGNPGYREVINSNNLWALISRHRNVVAWLHGHNHQFEIVKRDIVHASNGRIGGFEPPWGVEIYGREKLGGMYVEVSESGFSIRAFNATDGVFFDQQGHSTLSIDVPKRTTFSRAASSTASFGHGSSLQGHTLPVHRHFIGFDETEISLLQLPSLLNSDADFKFRTVDTGAGLARQKIVAASISGKLVKWAAADDGITIRPAEGVAAAEFQLSVPRMARGYHSPYFPCIPSEVYRVGIEINTFDQDSLFLNCSCIDSSGTIVKTATKPLRGTGTIKDSLLLEVPPHEGSLRLIASLSSSNLSAAVSVSRFAIELDSPAGRRHRGKPQMDYGQSIDSLPSSPAKGRAQHDLVARAATPIVFWARNTCSWQVRNATALFEKSLIVVQSIRNSHSPNLRVHLAPTQSPKPLAYVFRVEGVRSFNTLPAYDITKALTFSSSDGTARVWIRHEQPIDFGDSFSVDNPSEVEAIVTIPKGKRAEFYFV